MHAQLSTLLSTPTLVAHGLFNKVAGDTQGLPTVPHNDFGALNFKGLASKYLLLMTLPPADDEKMKKKIVLPVPQLRKRPRILHPRRKFAIQR